MLDETQISNIVAGMMENLHEWREPEGKHVPTEPDPMTRAENRIRLRACIRFGDYIANGQLRKWPGYDEADREDMQRIFLLGQRHRWGEDDIR